MGWDLDIDGSSRKAYVSRQHEVTLEQTANERSVLTFTLLPGYVPDRFDPVVMYEDDGVTEKFTGVVLDREIGGLVPGDSRSLCKVTCVDQTIFGDWTPITLEYTTPTPLETVLNAIAAAITAEGHSFTMDPSQATGPTLEPFAWVDKTATECWRDLSQWTESVMRTSPSGFKMLALGSEAAPVSMTEAAPNHLEFKWKDSAKTPATKVTLICGSGTGTATEDFTQVGVEVEYVTKYPASSNIDDTWPNQLIVNSTVVGPVFWGTMAGQWYWDYANNKLVNDTGTPLTPGDVVTVGQTVIYPFRVVENSGASPTIHVVRSRADILVYEQGVMAAEGLIATLNQQPREVTCQSRVAGFKPCQAVTVSLSTSRQFAGTMNLTAVRSSLDGEADKDDTELYWVNDLDGLESEIYQGSDIQEWRDLVETTSSAGSTTGGGGSSVSTLGGVVAMGGSWSTFLRKPVAAWDAIPGHYIYYAQSTYTGRVRIYLWTKNSGITVQARLVRIDAGPTYTLVSSPSSVITADTATETTFNVDIVAGERYFIQIISGSNDEGVYAASAQLEGIL